MLSHSLDVDKLLSIEAINCSIERLQRAMSFSVIDQTDGCDNGDSALHSTAIEYKDEGNAHFKRASYLAAALSWSRGLRIEPNNDLLLLNRSLGYLKIEWYEAALRDSEAVLARCSTAEHLLKAGSRAAWAEYGLGQYKNALQRFELNDGILPLTQWISRCKQRIREQSTGDYKWVTLFKEWQVKYRKDSIPIPRLDIADYIGPVEVRAMDSRGGGRGIVATRDIKSGELLVMSKPFTSAYPSELPPSGHLLYKADSLRVVRTCKDMLTPKVVEKIIGRPECAALVMNLYPGAGFPSPANTYSLSPITSPLEVPLHVDGNLDIAHVNAIININCFAANSIREAEFTKTIDAHEPAALHLLPSLFNHACFTNTVRYTLGDVMVIRANQDIRCGTELTTAYAGGGNHLTRGQSLTRLLGHELCDCKLCTLDRADGDEACRKREEILLEHGRTKEFLDRSKVPVSSVIFENNYRCHIDAIENTYAPERGYLRPATFLLHLALAQTYMERAAENYDISLYDNARMSIFAGLAAVGVVRKQTLIGNGTYIPIASDNLPCTGAHEDAVICMVQVAMTYHCQGKRLEAQEWVRAVNWLHAACRGGDVTFFDARFNGFLREINPKLPELFRGMIRTQ